MSYFTEGEAGKLIDILHIRTITPIDQLIPKLRLYYSSRIHKTDKESITSSL